MDSINSMFSRVRVEDIARRKIGFWEYIQQVRYIQGSWLLFCIASHIIIALPTIATVMVIFSLSRDRATTIAIAIVGRAITI